MRGKDNDYNLLDDSLSKLRGKDNDYNLQSNPIINSPNQNLESNRQTVSNTSFKSDSIPGDL